MPNSFIKAKGPTHKLRTLWLSFGWVLVALVIYLSLISDPLPIDAIGKGKLTYGIAHVLAYGTLMLWFLQLYPTSRRPIIALSLIALGTALEVFQGFVPGRDAEFRDIIANAAGVMLGWLLGKTSLSRGNC